MLQKILIPIISLIGYVFYLLLLNPFIGIVESIPESVFIMGAAPSSKAIIDIALIMGGSLLLKSLSTEWAFVIAGRNGKAAFATQINTVIGEAGAPFRPAKRVIRSGTEVGAAVASGGTSKAATLSGKLANQTVSGMKKTFSSLENKTKKFKVEESALEKRKQREEKTKKAEGNEKKIIT